MSRAELDRLKGQWHEPKVTMWYYMGSRNGFHYFHHDDLGGNAKEARISEAELSWPHTFPRTRHRARWRRLEFSVCDGCFALPSQFETVRAIRLNRRPAPVRPQGWRFLQRAPELVLGAGLSDIIDLGDHFATARDLPEPMPLMIYWDKPEVGTAHAIIQGTTADGHEVMRGDFPGQVMEPGERIQIVGAGFAPVDGTPAQPLVTRHAFERRPSVVTKSVTRGHVSLLGYKAGEEPIWLATFRPNETNPSPRRYKLRVTPTMPVSVEARVGLRFVPAQSEHVRSMIRFRPGFEIYAQALRARRASHFDDYQRFRNSALSKLNRQREIKTEGQTHMPSVSRLRSGASLATARSG